MTLSYYPLDGSKLDYMFVEIENNDNNDYGLTLREAELITSIGDNAQSRAIKGHHKPANTERQ